MGKALPLQIVNLHAAGIDVGSRSHFVAIDQNKESVRSFGIGNKDHQELILHLRNSGITSVAMESTGTSSARDSVKEVVQELSIDPGRLSRWREKDSSPARSAEGMTAEKREI